MSVFTKRLKRERQRLGLSQERLGVLAGIDEASASARMNQYETGKYHPDYQTVERIARALDIPVGLFYTEDELEAEIIVLFHTLADAERMAVLELARKLSHA